MKGVEPMGTLLAQIALFPGGIIAWIVVGLIAGWLAGVVMRAADTESSATSSSA